MKHEIYNEKVLQIFTFKYNPLKYLYHKFRIPIILWRQLKYFFGNKITEQLPKVKINNLAQYSEKFKKNGYVFINNFLDEKTYDVLLQNWPSKNYFKPSNTIFKSYDFAFKWTPKIKHTFQIDEPKQIKKNNVIKSILNYFFLDKTSELITKFCNDGISRQAYSFVLTWANKGSALIPHIDGISEKEGGSSFINIIYFINSSSHNSEDCGGTAIYKNNSFDQLLFRPTNLKNSALIYKSDKNIFHGFKPMKKNAFRWTINIQFSSKEFILNDIKKYSS